MYPWKRKKSILLVVGGIIILAFIVQDNYLTALAIRVSQRARLAVARLPHADIFLPVEFDQQDHALSCEVAALKMLLAYRNVHVEESNLITAVGTDATVQQVVDGTTIWGDPQKAFVGDIDGRMPTTGYGVYWEPIKRVAAEYRPARSFTGGTAADLARELQLGNPILIWGHLGSGRQFSWETPKGSTVNAVYYEHVFVINGLKGDVENPTGFFVMDPIYGQRYWSTATLMRHWKSLGYSAVVVY